jgi:hypothetical protein
MRMQISVTRERRMDYQDGIFQVFFISCLLFYIWPLRTNELSLLSSLCAPLGRNSLTHGGESWCLLSLEAKDISSLSLSSKLLLHSYPAQLQLPTPWAHRLQNHRIPRQDFVGSCVWLRECVSAYRHSTSIRALRGRGTYRLCCASNFESFK